MGSSSRRRQRVSLHTLLVASAVFTVVSLLILTIRSIDLSDDLDRPITSLPHEEEEEEDQVVVDDKKAEDDSSGKIKACATVEEMGDDFRGAFWEDSLKLRLIIQRHFHIHGASRVRDLPPEQFYSHGFVLGKSSEAGFGNEMYKILTGAALSIMLNRSLIIGKTRGKFPFGDYISYSDLSFTLNEVKHLWRQNECATRYGRHLVMRIDDFQKPVQSNILCSNWKEWEQPIIWLQNTTDAVAAQFFLKNIHGEMKQAASNLFGLPENLQHRPNVYGELMRVLISPSEEVSLAVNSVLNGGRNPDIALHMRMLMNRSLRAVQAALNCIRKAMHEMQLGSRPRLVLVSDSPSIVKDIKPILQNFAEVLHFDYEHFGGNISGDVNGLHSLNFRVKDWGPAPRWVAFVDFFLASRAKHAVISGAHRRVGTTYSQLIAALAAAHSVVENTSASSNFSFLSSFQNNLLLEGLHNQVGWGHVWNRFAGPLSCHNQSTQCAFTPLLPLAWWDGLWQSPIPRDIRRMKAFGVQLSGFGSFNDEDLNSYCDSRKTHVVTVTLI